MFALKWTPFRYTSKQFGIWRIAFGFYLLYYYLALQSYVKELYSQAGPFANQALFASQQTFFPSFLLKFDSLASVYAMNLACAFFALLIMLGFFRRTAAFFLWLLIMWFANRNPVTDSPEFPFVNWLVVVLILIPRGEKFSLGAKDPDWQMPVAIYRGAWLLISIGYLYAGSQKLRSMDTSWLDGSAMYNILNLDHARFDWYGNLFMSIPMPVFRVVTYTALTMQTGAFLFIFFRRSRPWWWLIATSTHLGFLCVANFPQLTLGMLLFHFFLLDSSWLEHVRRRLKSAERIAA